MPYIADGYIEEGYYWGGTIIPSEPTDNIVTINKSVTLNGEDITKYVTKLSINKTADRTHSVCELEMSGYTVNKTYVRNKDILLKVIIETDEVDFIIVDLDEDTKQNSILICKTLGCLLDYPFSGTYENQKAIGSANQIIADLCGGIPYSNSLPDFSFNTGSFLLNGTKIDALEALVSVSGGTLYTRQGRLFISEHFRISQSEQPKIILNDSVLTKKIKSENFESATSVKSVTFNPSVGDVYSEPKITMFSDECNKPYFLFNPTPTTSSDINSNFRSFSLTNKQLIYEGELLDTRLLIVDGGILEIGSVYVNSELVNDYTFSATHNVILFNTAKSGSVRVVYISKVVERYSAGGYTADGINYQVQYLNQFLEQLVPYCETGESDNTDGSSGEVSCSVEISDIKRDTEFYIDIEGDSVTTFEFISDASSFAYKYNYLDGIDINVFGYFDHSFLSSITKSTFTKTKNSSFTIENITSELKRSSKIYGFFSSRELSDFMVGVVKISLSKTSSRDGYYYYTTSSKYLNSSVSASYNFVVDRYTVPACGVSNTVKYLQVIGCGTVTIEYPNTLNENDSGYDPTETDVCVIPAEIVLDIPNLLGIDAALCANKQVEILAPIEIPTLGIKTTLINGKLHYNFTHKTTYIVECDSIRGGATITIDTTNAQEVI